MNKPNQNKVTCHYCGAKFSRVRQAQRAVNICQSSACQSKYFREKMREHRAQNRTSIDGTPLPSHMTVVSDPSGCFDSGVKLLAVMASVKMGCLPPGLMLDCGSHRYRVDGREATDAEPGRETLVQIA